jgi:hypothetical protein
VSNESDRPTETDSAETDSAAGVSSTEKIVGDPADERAASTTVGTGSYIALSCTVIALFITFVILGILFLLRWL